MSKVRNYLSGLLLSVALASCTTDAYDKGEGKYSLMRGEFVEAYADEHKHIPYITTDDGELLPLLQDFTANWVTTADSTYRCRVYYNKVTQLDGSTKALRMASRPILYTSRVSGRARRANTST